MIVYIELSISMKNTSNFNYETTSNEIESDFDDDLFHKKGTISVSKTISRRVIGKQEFKESVTPEADEATSLSGLLMKSRRFIDEPA